MMHISHILRFLVLCGLMLISHLLVAQTDSTERQQLDSSLRATQAQTNALVEAADSAHIADSLAQDALQKELDAIRADDLAAKQKLQARLDSVKAAQAQRAEAFRKQADSLRANTQGAPVKLFDDTLFFIYSRIGPFSAVERAESATRKLEKLVDEDMWSAEKLKVIGNADDHSVDITHEDVILLSIIDRDGFWADTTPETLARTHASTIEEAVAEYQKANSFINNILRIGLLVLVLLLFVLMVRYMNRFFTWLNDRIIGITRKYLKGVRLGTYEFLSAEQEERVVRFLLRILKWLVIALVVYLVLPIVLSIFPATQGIAYTLFGYVLNPLLGFGKAILGYIPELITIIVIVVITRYIIRFLKFLSLEIEAGKLVLPGFHTDWAQPTFNLVKIIIIAFSFIVIFPYLPGSDSPVFQGVSVFLGILLSLGSSSAIGNIIAGLVITYMRPFKLGDRVKIGDVTGDVIEKTMLVTRVRTTKNEDVTIPNSAILNGSTVNFTSNAEGAGLILHTTVTIGYDVPWRTVHELLIGSAQKTTFVEEEPKPFVLQTSLDDFYVSYQLNAYTRVPEKAAGIYSELHSHIQDAFNEAGVEILSPHYRAARDGNTITLPPDYLPPNYKAPGFNVNINKPPNEGT